MPAAAGSARKESTLLERGAQLAQLARKCDAIVGGGAARLTVISGPAGIGKTAMLRAGSVLATARGFTALHARGALLESEFPFGVVHQLFDPILASTPPPARAALFDGAAGLALPLVDSWLPGRATGADAPQKAESLFGVLHGLYWLLANLAEGGPLALAVDDAQWADPSSLRFLSYLAQRLEDIPVLVLLVARIPQETHDSGTLWQLITGEATDVWPLAPLSEAAVAGMVGDAFHRRAAAPEFCVACHRASAGNPFIVGELLAELRREGISPTAANAERIAGLHPASVARMVLVRLARLGREPGEMARAIAILGSGPQSRLAGELAGLEPGAAAAAIDSLADADFIVSGTAGEFVHPLVRDAVYDSIPPARRGQVHARAARLLADQSFAPEVVATHLLKSEPAGQAWAVDTLRTVATRALSHGAAEMAMTYLRRAHAEPPSRGQRGEVLGELGMAAAAAQDPEAIDHLGAAMGAVESQLVRCRLALLLARQLTQHGRHADAVATLEHAINDVDDASSNRDLSLRLEAQLVMIMNFDRSLHPAAWRRLERFNLEAEPDGPGKAMLLANLARRSGFAGEPVEGTVALAEQAVADWRGLVDEDAGSALLALALRTLALSDELERADELYAQVLVDAVERGRLATWALMTSFRSECAFRSGNVADAELYAREGTAAAAAHGIGIGVAYGAAFLAEALVETGQLEAALEALGQVPADGKPSHLEFIPHVYARGLVRHAMGDPAGALTDLLACGERQLAWDCVNPAVMPWRSKAALACASLGRDAEARALAAEELTLARRFGAPRAIGIALHASGLVAEADQSLLLLAEAVTTLEGSKARLELTRALVDYGRGLRQAGRRTEARDPLRRGLDLASRCGATMLASVAREELISTGARPRRARLVGITALTASELRVARLAAREMTNRQIAQQLFLSTKTVAVHLTHVYQKLGITSRGELPRELDN